MVAAWLLTPLFLGALALGWGLLLDRASGARLPGALLVPAGFAAYLVGARLLTTTQLTTGTVATVVAVLVAIAGYVLGWRRLRVPRTALWTVAAAVGVFAVFAAPVVLSGKATFAGYGVLGDTAFQFVLTDALMDHHGDVSGLPNSAFRTTADAYSSSGYPVGAHAALGTVRPLTGQDVAWVYQPFLAFLMALLALSLAGLLRNAIPDVRVRALAAFVAAQPALVYAFALQGSIKELSTLLFIPVLAALVAVLLEPERRLTLRSVVPLAVTAAAAISVIGPAAVLWLAPILVVAVVMLLRKPEADTGSVVIAAGSAIAGAVILSLPTLAPLANSLDTQSSVLTAQSEVGNLARPLKVTQVLGVYFSGDYRLPPAGSDVLSAGGITAAFSGAVILAGLIGLVAAVRRRLTGPLLFAGVSALAFVVVLPTGSPWADSKAIAIASPAALMLAVIGVWAVAGRREVLVGAVLAVAVGAGVLVSNAYAYHSASLAPRDRLEELSSVGERLDGRGPTLATEFEEFAKHFARDARPVTASEALGGTLQPRARPGGDVRFGFPTDLDSIEPADVQRFPALLLRRSPGASRPPFNYRRTWTGRYYEIWQRRGGPRRVIRLPLGSAVGRQGNASCRRVARLAARVPGGTLVTPREARDITLPVSRRVLPPKWVARGDDPTLVAVAGPGAITGPIYARSAGRYRVWLRGGINRRVTIQVDGRTIGSVKNQLAQPAAWDVIGTVQLSAGRHTVRIYRGGGTLAPGNGDVNRTLGPVTLEPEPAPSGLIRVPARDYRRVCGRSLDWVEAIPR